MESIGLEHFLVVGVLVFALGLALMGIRRSRFHDLLGLQFMLGGVTLNLAAFERFLHHSDGSGRAWAIVLLALVAAQSAAVIGLWYPGTVASPPREDPDG